MKIKCQKCSEKATLHITEVTDTGHEEVHLCQNCAKKYLHEVEEAAPSMSAPASEMMAAAENVVSFAKCPTCKTTFAEFRSTGRLGCPRDYEVFRAELRPLLENIHGGLRHIGKVPRRLPPDTQLQTRLIQLRQELQQAVAIEDYERAASLRDQIETLEQEK